MKQCSKCSELKPVEMFVKRAAVCKKCKAEYQKEYYKNNSEHFKQRSKQCYLNNPEYYKQWNRIFDKNNQLPYHIVYLLPDHNYVGVTNRPHRRMKSHVYEYNRNTDNWIELARFDNRKDALKCEAEYHAKGYAGAKGEDNVLGKTKIVD